MHLKNDPCNPNGGSHVAVIGAGVVGLTSAIRLLEAGLPVTVFSEKRTPHVTSNRAGAVFTPFRIDGNPRAEEWTRLAHARLCEIAEQSGEVAGVGLTPIRELFFEPIPGRPWWTEFVQGYEHPSTAPPGYADVVHALVPRMDMTRYMPWLEARFADLGGQFIQRHVGAFSELFEMGYCLIVNCAGLGARELVPDTAMMPMRGQILHVASGMTIPECLVEDGRGSLTTYVFPFPGYTVLGGTCERGEEQEATDEPALEGILQRCRKMLTACGYQELDRLIERRLKAVAGLRPARVEGGSEEAVRLELVEFEPDRWVIHNYGHGRAGVTLSWGCASDVARLVDRVVC